VIREEIPSALDGERIDRTVAMLTGCTRAEAAAALAANSVRVDGIVITKPSSRVREGVVVEVAEDPHTEPPLPAADPSVDVEVVYADDTVIVVNKPAGLVVHPGAGVKHATLVNGLLARFPELAEVGESHRPGIVHRLDKGTSGLMVVARTEDAYEDLVAQLSSHDVERAYVALVIGRFETNAGTVDAPIGRSRRNPLLMTVSAEGRESRTHYHVDARFDDPIPLTLLECRLETGRTHQIRVHLRSIGRPVLGDELYGGQRPFFEISRPFLHAKHLGFMHPATDEPVEFEVPLAADLQGFLSGLTPVDPEA
jgi:23S rRNA pseudouridine1911/1915/1917 synthase